MTRSLANISGVTSRTSKLINNKGSNSIRNGSLKLKKIFILKEEKTNLMFKSLQKRRDNCLIFIGNIANERKFKIASASLFDLLILLSLEELG